MFFDFSSLLFNNNLSRKPSCLVIKLSKNFQLIILLFTLATFFFITLRIIAYGYFPSDDALRHVGKVVSGKSWDEVLVIRSAMTMDSHPGWHVLLTSLNKTVTPSPTNLLNFSVLFFFLLFTLPPAFFLRRPEAWVTTFILFAVFSPSPIYRLLYGRPFIFSMFLVVLFCFFWRTLSIRGQTLSSIALFALLAALSTWIHGTWYLLLLPLLALLLSREWWAAGKFLVSIIIGIVLGASLTGHPFSFLYQMLFHAYEAFNIHDFQRQLVTEFQPFSGDSMALLLVVILLFWRKIRGDWNYRCVDNPVFILGAIGWILGFIAVRFWTDWGWPAVLCWAAIEVQSFLEKYVPTTNLKRVGLTFLLCLVLFLALTNDRGSRWSSRTMLDWPTQSNVEQKPWLPDNGGILYTDSMSVFYNIFFHNPHAPWKYILGFEPAWMTEDDLKIYRHIQLTRGKDGSYLPWVKKMTTSDRMILLKSKKPTISSLEWHEIAPTVWSGRLY